MKIFLNQLNPLRILAILGVIGIISWLSFELFDSEVKKHPDLYPISFRIIHLEGETHSYDEKTGKTVQKIVAVEELVDLIQQSTPEFTNFMRSPIMLSYLLILIGLIWLVIFLPLFSTNKNSK